MTPLLLALLVVIGGATRAYFRYKLGALALKDVPVEQRPAVLEAFQSAWPDVLVSLTSKRKDDPPAA